MPTPLVPPEIFAEWLLEEQVAFLDDALSAQSLDSLVELCARSADTAPLQHLVQRASTLGLPLPGTLMLSLPSSTLQTLLEQPLLEEPAEAAWSQASLEDLVSFCLLDRYLRRRQPDRWEALQREVTRDAETRLSKGIAADSGLLMRLPGSEHRRLRSLHPEGWASWRPLWRETARQAIKLLAERPRDVSQANAEKLLAQQVYTDPGHFLLELLQNADDAGATRFAAEFSAGAIAVRHNGAPFDFRDLVGLLSIGQTTKKSSQIGYFGVGFKSVYEVTDRPRLTSGELSFEIADISVPRALSAEPDEESTILVLPLKKGLDSDLFWHKALAIDAGLLLNVPNLRALVWRRDGLEHHVRLDALEGEEHTLREGGDERRYLRWTGLYRHRGERPPGKATRAAIQLAFPLDGRAVSTTLYSFLPISESSGLRFIVGSHFDVPVDRERLDVASAWNRELIATLPTLIGERFREDPRRAWQLLSLLPLPGDALAPLFEAFPEDLVGELRTVPLVPRPDGGYTTAANAWLLDPVLQPLFPPDDPTFVHPPDERSRLLLQRLGASSYSLPTLLEDLERGLRPGRLDGPDPDVWSTFHRLLAGVDDLARLRRCPILLDAKGQPARPQDVILLEASWRSLFLDAPPSVHPSQIADPVSAGLLARLGLTAFGWTEMTEILRRGAGAARVHLPNLYQRMLEAPRGVALTLLEQPIFPDRNGRLGSLVSPQAHQWGIVAAHPDVPLELFPDWRFLAQEPSLERLLHDLGWARLDLSAALQALSTGKPPTAELAEQLLAAISESEQEWTATGLERLVSFPIFEGTDGRRLALSSLWRHEEEGLATLLPAHPGLATGSLSQSVAQFLELEHRLRRANLDTLIDSLRGLDATVTLPYLADRAAKLSGAQLERLFAMPLFEGKALARPDSPPRAGTIQAAKLPFITVLEALGLPVLGQETTRLIAPLLQASGYRPLGLDKLVEVLQTKAPDVELLRELQTLLIEESLSLELAFSRETRQALPVWKSREGQVVTAAQLAPTDELAEVIGRPRSRPAPDQPAPMAELFPMLESEAFLRATLQREAKMGEPLSRQPAWCNSVEAVDKVASHLQLSSLMVDAEGRLRAQELHHAHPAAYPWLLRSPLAGELVHPQSSREQKRDCHDLDAALILETYFPLRSEKPVREAFYAYLQAELGRVVAQPEARAFLMETALWRSAENRWKSLRELVLDADIPDLGGDWTPHSEIPAELLERLASALDIGRPDPAQMLEEHLLPAYRRGRSRLEILPVMARLSRDLETARVRRMLRPPDGAGSFPLPDGTNLSTAYYPPSELEGLPNVAPTTSVEVEFLRRLGLPYLPPAESLERAEASLRLEDGEALGRLVDWAWHSRAEELEPLWPTLARLAWLPAKDGKLRLPRQLFVRTADLEELVGDSPELFPRRKMAVGLARKLGLKEEDDLDGALVVRHLQRQSARGERVSPRLYAFLDRALQAGRLSGAYLRGALERTAWIWTDEGEYRTPTQVLSQPAFRLFGPHRGTWEGAHERYPHLSALFAIPREVTSEVILAFLSEMRNADVSESLLRLLKACLARLGGGEEAVVFPREWRVLPARLASDGSPVLVAADQAGLVRSSTPSLVALFALSGRLVVVDPGDSDSAADLDRLYARLGIPLLRDAYTVELDRSGGDVTDELGEAVARFRQLLRALWGVLPRLRAARPQWEEGGEWLAEERLRHFAGSGPVRVLDNLRLTFKLPGVGAVAVEAASAFDPQRRELLLSAPALVHPEAHAVALSDGLVDLLYQGPGTEGLVDLLNLLIPLLSQDAMEAYLDRRHFPRLSHPASNPQGLLHQRLGEFLDYGLQRRLGARFPELARADWSRWRDADLSAVESDEPALHLLNLLGLEAPSAELVEALSAILEAADLETGIRSLGPESSETFTPPAYPSEAAQEAPRAQPAAARPAVTPAAGQGVTPMPPASASPVGQGLAGVKDRLLARVGQWLGTSTETPQAMSYNTEISDLAETYRNPPPRHLVVSSRALQGADLYCVSLLGVDFDARRQLYLPARVDWPDLFAPSGRTVELTGRLTLPNHVLPKPLLSRLSRAPSVRGSRGTLRGPDSYGEYRLRTEDPDAVISYAVELSVPPVARSSQGAPVEARFLRPTAPSSSLPAMVREWIAWARGSDLPRAQLAQRARDFVAAHYLYDLGFLDRDGAKEVLARPLASGENQAIALLHAGASGRYLGRGVCMELSALLLEMLRRAGIPAILASVWMLDSGLIHQPDHAIVLVALDSDRGLFWSPLDPSIDRMPGGGGGSGGGSGEEEPPLSRADLLQMAADIVLGPGYTLAPEMANRERAQEAALLAYLGDKPRLETLLESIGRSGRYLRSLDPQLEWLVEKGYLAVEEEQLFRIWTGRGRSPGPR